MPMLRADRNKLLDFSWNMRSKGIKSDLSTTEIVHSVVERLTGIEPELGSTLDDLGIASIGIPRLVEMLNGDFSRRGIPLSITAIDLIEANSIADIITTIENAAARFEEDGV